MASVGSFAAQRLGGSRSESARVPMRVGFLGAGAWGSALAHHAASKASNDVLIWARSPLIAEQINQKHRNLKALGDARLAPSLKATSDLHQVLRHVATTDSLPSTGLIVLGTAMSGMREVLEKVYAFGSQAPILCLSKGLEADSDSFGHEVFEACWSAMDQSRLRPSYGMLSGPSFAAEVVRGLPCALTVSSVDAALQDQTVAAFHHAAMRIYSSDDLIGSEIAGAVKNVIAIAAGAADGLELGLNARAALITRGLSEMVRLGAAYRAKPETFTGLVGVGDLMLTCTGNLSRNRQVGFGLAQGLTLTEILAQLGHVAEGVACARAAQALAQKAGLDLPIIRTVGRVLFSDLPVKQAVSQLLARDPKAEQDEP
jgi:glycerol-3-phosphate dehydrogenase (NAD(P)+)